MKTSELIGTQLDFWVAKAEGLAPYQESGRSRYWLVEQPSGAIQVIGETPIPEYDGTPRYAPSVLPALGNEIISRRGIRASDHITDGTTPLIAAMRAYVASKFGDEVPD